MFHNFSEVLRQAKKRCKVTISVAAAQDKDALLAVKAAREAGLADAILVGDKEKISKLAVENDLNFELRIVHEPDSDRAALAAVSLVKQGEAQILMKGLINSSNFLRAVLDQDHGLRTGKILSHLAAFEIPGEEKLIFHTDGGMNIAPTLEQKKEILINAIQALQRMGIEKPNVAVVTANEQVNPKMPATVDAKALVDMNKKGLLPDCTIEGPMAMDVAASPMAAVHKGIKSSVAGKVDLLLVPTIEAGNLVGKTLVYYAKAKNSGIILGATHPIVMVSRSDPAESKLNSLALASLALSRNSGS